MNKNKNTEHEYVYKINLLITENLCKVECLLLVGKMWEHSSYRRL
jgi:hypothetical protein